MEPRRDFFEKTCFRAPNKSGFGGFKMVVSILFLFRIKLLAKNFRTHSIRASGDKIRLLCASLKLKKFSKNRGKIEEKIDLRRKMF